MSNDIKVPKYWHVSLWNAVWTANVWDNSPRVRNISKSSTALSRLSHCSLAVQTSSPDRHPGGEILSLSDWLIDTRSYCDWLVFYEDGKFARPITLPPRDNRWLSIGGKLKFTDLIGWANVDRIGRFGRFGRFGSDRTPNSGFPDLPLPQPQLRVFTSNEFQAAVYSCVFCSVYCNFTAVILKSVLPNEMKKKENSNFHKN